MVQGVGGSFFEAFVDVLEGGSAKNINGKAVLIVDSAFGKTEVDKVEENEHGAHEGCKFVRSIEIEPLLGDASGLFDQKYTS